ncbi:hypothetical protein [Xylophilus ampelinus]|uniref:hypothetical protein n=1 Tax=Xylophilus ampelinus TaxID=54067 RepID=UPI0011B3722D|nr:hypothetical protein [Xylophilus ampelinus]MCS4511902.1 hypothetical protein [Xylophilus ampelinus]
MDFVISSLLSIIFEIVLVGTGKTIFKIIPKKIQKIEILNRGSASSEYNQSRFFFKKNNVLIITEHGLAVVGFLFYLVLLIFL